MVKESANKIKIGEFICCFVMIMDQYTLINFKVLIRQKKIKVLIVKK